jgi:hypothetical protein
VTGARRAAAVDVPPPRRSRALARVMAFLALALVFTIAVVIAVVIATSTSNSVVHLRTIVARDAQSAISSLRDLINQYTK